MKITNEQQEKTKRYLRSIQLFLMAHPENEEDSEMADRISDIEELQEIFE